MTITQPLEKVKKKFDHLPYLDSLRGLAALCVAINHAGEVFPNLWAVAVDIKSVHSPIDLQPRYAVDLFIMLSGLCLMLPVIRNNGSLRGGIIVFYKKRARRILPPYYLAMGLSLLLIATVIGYKSGNIWDRVLPVTTKDIVTHLVLLHDLFYDTNTKINGVFWSISVEWNIYLLFPLIIIMWRKFGGFTTTVVTIILSNVLLLTLQFLQLHNLNTSPFGICPHFLGLFALGMLAAEIISSQQDTHTYTHTYIRKKLPWGLMTVVFAGIAMITYSLIPFNKSYPLCDLTIGLSCFSLLISIATSQKSWFYKLLVWKPLVFIGTFAYSIYLIHLPLEQLMYQYIIKPLNLTSFMSTDILSCLMTIVIIPISYLFFLLCEKPFINKKS